MKLCPFCRGELRDSVIRCTHCKRSLAEAAEDAAVLPAKVADVSVPGPAIAARASVTGTTAPAPPRPSAVDVWAISSEPVPRDSARIGDANSRPSPGLALTAPRRRPMVDAALLLAGLGLIVAGVLAFGSAHQEWIRLQITHLGEDSIPDVTARVTLRGDDALVGVIGLCLAIAMIVWGAIWTWYAFDAGTHVPVVAAPAIVILVTVAGIGAAALAGSLWFVWSEAAIAHAHQAGLTTAALRALLDQHPAPEVALQRMPSLMRFGEAMVLGQIASYASLWSNRRRGTTLG